MLLGGAALTRSYVENDRDLPRAKCITRETLFGAAKLMDAIIAGARQPTGSH